MSKQVAAAVNGYCKALRLLGREDVSMGQIATALRISPEEVESAFKDFKISGSEVSKTITRAHSTVTSKFYPVISFKRRANAQPSKD